MSKRCSRCRRELPVDAFSCSAKAKDGRQWTCRACQSAVHAARRERTQHQDCLYAVACGSFVKIGKTRNIDRRLSWLQCGNPIALELLFKIDGAGHLEKEVHALFARERYTGEWYRPSCRLLEWIRLCVDADSDGVGLAMITNFVCSESESA